MCKIPKEAVLEFQELFLIVVGKQLSYEEAEAKALEWMKFVHLILKK